jgi:hypothetical protein
MILAHTVCDLAGQQAALVEFQDVLLRMRKYV